MENLTQLLERETLSIPQLVAEPLPPTDIIDPLQRELAEKAMKELGYGQLLEEIQQVDRAQQVKVRLAQYEYKKRALRIKVREVLKEMDREPYSTTSVEAYKSVALDKVENAQMVPVDHRIEWPEKSSDICGWPIFLSIVGLVVSFVCLFVGKDLAGWGATVSSGLLTLSIVGAVIYEYARRPRKKEVMTRVISGPGYQWVKMPLRGFGLLIPEFPIDTALRLKERLPEAEFFVDVLRSNEVYRPRFDDPFLVLRIAGEEHYIEVWDETDFETTNRR